MKKKIGIGLLAFALAATSVACGSQPETAGTENRGPVVSVGKAEKGSLSNVMTISGKISPKASAKIVPKTPGKVAKINFDVGQEVKAGQVLMELESTDIRANVALAQAGVAAAEADLQGAQIRLADAEKVLGQKQALLDAGAISQYEFDMAKKEYDLAVAAATPARLEQAKATLQLRMADLDNTLLKAPIDGIVASRSINVGEMASSATPAFEIVNIQTVEVEATLTEKDINHVKDGQEVDVKVSAVAAEPFKGKVSKISPKADDKSKTYPIWVTIENPDKVLKPGMFGEIMLETMRKDDVVTVPAEAVVDRNGSKVVYVLAGSNAVERKVQIGITDGKKSEIVEGLQAGETIILSNLQTLADGMAVTPQEGQATPPSASQGAAQ